MKAWDWSSFLEYLISPYLLAGVWNTIWLTVLSLIIGLVLGLLSALMRMSKNPLINGPAKFYIWIWRGTPLLVQLVIIYTGLPQLGIRLSVVQSALIGLGVNEGAYLSEIIRAGILSVDKGQFNAARALGMNYKVMMRRIILPQAARIIVPPLGNRFNGLLKFSSLASVISMEELMRRAQMLTQAKFRVLEIFIVAAIYYLILTTIWGQVQKRIEARFEKAYTPTGETRTAKRIASGGASLR
jgi:polar amino acid transport system permease protein